MCPQEFGEKTCHQLKGTDGAASREVEKLHCTTHKNIAASPSQSVVVSTFWRMLHAMLAYTVEATEEIKPMAGDEHERRQKTRQDKTQHTEDKTDTTQNTVQRTTGQRDTTHRMKQQRSASTG